MLLHKFKINHCWFCDKDIKKKTVCFVYRIKYASKAGDDDIPLDWALGAFILNTATATFDYSGKSRKILDFE